MDDEAVNRALREEEELIVTPEEPDPIDFPMPGETTVSQHGHHMPEGGVDFVDENGQKVL